MGGVAVSKGADEVTTKLAIVINEQRLRQLMLEFLREQNYDDSELLYQLKFSEFMLWLQRRQQGGGSDGNEAKMQHRGL